MTTAANRAVEALVRRRRRRRWGVAGLAVVALVDLAGSLLPRSAAELLEIDRSLGLRASFGARAGLAVLGVGAIVLVRGLWRGQRRAWAAAVSAAGLSAAFQVVRDASVPAAALCAAIALALLVDHRSYAVAGRVVRLPGLAAPGLFVAVGTYAGAGWAEHADGLPDLSVLGRARVVARGMTFLSPGVAGTTPAARAFLDALPIAGAAVLAVLAAGLFLLSRADRRSDRKAAGALAVAHGRTSAAPLAVLDGNDLLELPGGALVGLRVWAGVAVAVGPPISAGDDPAASLEAFVNRCETYGWVPTVLDADAASVRAGADLGFSALKIGEEAVVDLEGFSLIGRARANVRHSATRAERDGVAVLRYDTASRTEALDRQLGAISDAWLATKHGPELGFTLGRFHPDGLDDQEVFVAATPEGAVAFLTWLPYAGGRAAVLDLMRRGEGAPPGVMDLLIARSLDDLGRRGYRQASLGGVPLASTTERVTGLEQALGWMYEHGESVYEAKGLFAFKRKFDPRWEPIHLLYPTASDLPRIAVAVGRAFLPRGFGALQGWVPRRRPR